MMPIRMNDFSADDPRCYGRIPPVTLTALRAWVDRGSPPGGFLSAVLTNDLAGAVEKGDLENLRALPAIVAYIFNCLPVGCWGTWQKMSRWRAQFDQAAG